MNFNDFNLNKNDYLYLGLLFLFICALSYCLLENRRKSCSFNWHINDKGYINDLVNITEYVKSNDPDYHSKTFGCHGHPTRMIRYYLQTNVTISDDDNKVLDSSNVDYIIINDKVDFKNYEKLYRCGEYFLYSHN